MSQLGMQMPGAQRARKARMNVYTTLLLAAVLVLVAANAIVYLNASKVAPADAGLMGPFTMHEEGRINLN